MSTKTNEVCAEMTGADTQDLALLKIELNSKNDMIRELKNREAWLSAELFTLKDETNGSILAGKDDSQDHQLSKDLPLESLLTKPNLSPEELVKARARIFHTLSHFHRELVKAKAIINHNSKAIVHAELRKTQTEEEASYFRQLLEQVKESAEKTRNHDVLQGFKLLEKDRTKKLRASLEASQAEILSLQEKLAQMVQYATHQKEERLAVASEISRIKIENQKIRAELPQSVAAESSRENTSSTGMNTLEFLNAESAELQNTTKLAEVELKLKQALEEIEELVGYQVQAQADIDEAVAQKNMFNDENQSLKGKLFLLEVKSKELSTELEELKHKISTGPPEPSIVRSSSLNNLQASRQVDELAGEVKGLNATVSRLESELKAKSKELEMAEAEIADAKARDRSQQLTQQVQELSKELDKQKAVYQDARNDCEMQRLAVKDILAAKVTIETKFSQLEQQRQRELDIQVADLALATAQCREKEELLAAEKRRVNELEEESVKLKSELNDLGLQLVDLQNDRTLNASAQETKLSTQIEAHNNEKQQLVGSLKDVSLKLLFLEESHASLSKDLEAIRVEKEELKTELDASKLNEQSLSKKYDAIDSERKNLAENVEQITREYSFLLEEINSVKAVKDELSAKNGTLEAEKQELRVKVLSLEPEKETLRSKLDDLNGELIILSERNRLLEATLETQGSSQSEQSKALLQRVSELERELEESREKMNEAERRLATFESEIEALNSNKSLAQYAQAQTEAKNEAMKVKLTELEICVADYEEEVRNLRDTIAKLETERSELQVLLDQKKDLELEIFNLKADHALASERLLQVTNEKEEVNAQVLLLKQKLEDELLKKQIADSEIQQFTSLCANFKKETESLQLEKEGLEQKYEALIASINSGSEEKMQALLAERESLAAKNVELGDRLNSFKEQNIKLEESAKEVQAHNLDMERTLIDITADNEELERQVQLLLDEKKAVIAKWEDSVREKEQAQLSLESEFENFAAYKKLASERQRELDEKCNFLSNDLEALKKELDKKVEVETKYQDQVSALEISLKSVEEQILIKAEEADRCKSDLERMELQLNSDNSASSQLALLTQEHVNLQENMKEWEVKCSELQASLEMAQQKSKKAQKEQQKIRDKLEKDIEVLRSEKQDAQEHSKELNLLLKKVQQEQLLSSGSQQPADYGSNELRDKYKEALESNNQLKTQIGDLEAMNKELLGRFKTIAEELDTAKRRTLQKGGTIQAANAEAMESLLRKLGDHEEQVQSLRDENEKLKEENVTLNMRLMEWVSSGNQEGNGRKKGADKQQKVSLKEKLFSDVVAGNNSDAKAAK